MCSPTKSSPHRTFRTDALPVDLAGVAIAALAAVATASQAQFAAPAACRWASRAPMMGSGPRLQQRPALAQPLAQAAQQTSPAAPLQGKGNRQRRHQVHVRAGDGGTSVRPAGARRTASVRRISVRSGRPSAPASSSARSARPAPIRRRRSRAIQPARRPRRGGINIPPGNEQRFVEDEVVLEFAGNLSPQAHRAAAARGMGWCSSKRRTSR